MVSVRLFSFCLAMLSAGSLVASVDLTPVIARSAVARSEVVAGTAPTQLPGLLGRLIGRGSKCDDDIGHHSCGDFCCPFDHVCCHNGCIPIGAECCKDGGQCAFGSTCTKTDGKQACCPFGGDCDGDKGDDSKPVLAVGSGAIASLHVESVTIAFAVVGAQTMVLML